MNCQERSGFLFAHACDREAVSACSTCQKQICEAHLRDNQGQPVCVTCLKSSAPPPDKRRTQDPYYDDPYWYSSYGSGYYTYYDMDDHRAFSSSRQRSTPNYENDPAGT